jgi:hypothetical protein
VAQARDQSSRLRKQKQKLAFWAQTAYVDSSFSEKIRSVLEFVVPPGPSLRRFARGDSAMPKESSMSTPPSFKARPAAAPAPAVAGEEQQPRPIRRPPLSKRLPAMTDEHLLSLQQAATRISLDPEHSKHGAATSALPLIDAEIGRRAAGLADPANRPQAGGAAGD